MPCYRQVFGWAWSWKLNRQKLSKYTTLFNAWYLKKVISASISKYLGSWGQTEGNNQKLVELPSPPEAELHLIPLMNWKREVRILQIQLGQEVVDHQGAVSIRETVLPGMAIPMLKIRRPNGRLIFNMEIAIRR